MRQLSSSNLSWSPECGAKLREEVLWLWDALLILVLIKNETGKVVLGQVGHIPAVMGTDRHQHALGF